VAIIAPSDPQWMPLLDAIQHVQKALKTSLKEAATVVLTALRQDRLPARRSGHTMPLDGQYELWGRFFPAAWRCATIHDDGTVSFDVSGGIPELRAARQHEIEVRHEIEVLREVVLELWPDAPPSNSVPAAKKATKIDAAKAYIAQHYPDGIPAGVTDKQIARDAGVSDRTVRRARGKKQ
jgi:hypothetical protein